jgi:hypothetical protein
MFDEWMMYKEQKKEGHECWRDEWWMSEIKDASFTSLEKWDRFFYGIIFKQKHSTIESHYIFLSNIALYFMNILNKVVFLWVKLLCNENLTPCKVWIVSLVSKKNACLIICLLYCKLESIRKIKQKLTFSIPSLTWFVMFYGDFKLAIMG